MPAIQLARLRQQSAALAETFDNAPAFVRALHDLLEFYASRSHRPGQTGVPPPLMDAYNVPTPVLRQLINDLTPLARGDSGQTLVLCAALWKEPLLEFRTLAATLLGLASPQPPPAIIQLVTEWVGKGAEDRLLESVVEFGLARLRKEQPEIYFQAVETWLTSEEKATRLLGLKAMLPIANGKEFENYPAYFHALTPFIRSSPSELRPYLLAVLQALAQRSPKETAYFLRQNLDAAGDPGAAWLARQLLAYFPAETRDTLRSALRRL